MARWKPPQPLTVVSRCRSANYQRTSLTTAWGIRRNPVNVFILKKRCTFNRKNFGFFFFCLHFFAKREKKKKKTYKKKKIHHGKWKEVFPCVCVCARVYVVNLLWTCCLPVTGDHHQPQCRWEEEELRCVGTGLRRRRRRDALGKRLLRPPEPRGSAEDGYGELYFPHPVDLRILILSYRLRFHGFRGAQKHRQHRLLHRPWDEQGRLQGCETVGPAAPRPVHNP